jgi:ubiquinone/menaquinone biosynthesis C-methylase UbiE
MSLYSKYVLPNLINIACNQSSLSKQREKVIPLAKGNVLEVGVGTGLNLPFYDKSKILKLTAIDPSEETWAKRVVDVCKLPYDFEYIPAPAEALPFEDNSFDSVVITYSLCTIPDTAAALKEIGRVLKKEGQLIFCEHGAAPDIPVRRTQNMMNPIWKPLAGGCNLNRDIDEIIESNGFKIENLQKMYLPGFKFFSFNYWGTAKKIL